MPNIIDILARALSLRQETALNSITPNRAGGIMYDTLLVLNQMQLEGGSLLISKVYASVSAMEADTTPTSDLTGRALKPGQLVVIVTSDSSSSDMGSEYRYNGPGSWTYVGKVGGLPLDTVPTQSSTKGITSGGVYAALAAMKAEGYKYMGIASPGSGGTAPGTPNQPVFYIAGPGSYPNFGSITVASGYLGFIKYSSGSWTVESVAVGKDYDSQISALDEQISQLEAEVFEKIGGEMTPSPVIEQGSMSSQTGEDTSSTTRLRTQGFIPAEAIHINPGSGKVYVFAYRENESYISAAGWLTEETDVNIDGAKKYRLSFAKTTDGYITPEGYAALGISYKAVFFSDFVTEEAVDELAQEVEENTDNTEKLLLSQYGVLQSVTASNPAGSRVQQKIIVPEGSLRFKANIVSGSPAYENYTLWLADSNSVLSVVIAHNLDFGNVYEVDVPSGYTGVTIRTGLSTPVGTIRFDVLGDSDEYAISVLQGYQTTKMVKRFSYSPKGNARLSKFVECSGVLRVKVSVGSGTPAGQDYRIYFGTASAQTDRIAKGDTPYGQSAEVYISPDFGYTGITIFTAVPETSNVRYDVTVEQMDTPEEKARHNERILCIGDSLTQFNGQNVVGAGVGRDGMRYSDWMHIFRPGVTITNIGIGGTRLAQRTAMSENPDTENKAYSALDMVSLVDAVCSGDFSYQDAAVAYLSLPGPTDAVGRAKLVDLSKIDIVTILGGTNDWASGNSLGTSDSVDKSTTLGALNSIISAILTANPRIRIFIALPPVRYYGSTFTDENWCDTYENGNGQTLLELCESLEAVAERNYTPTIDLHRALGWNKQNFWSFFITPDGTHPIAGFGWIARKMMHEIF